MKQGMMLWTLGILLAVTGCTGVSVNSVENANKSAMMQIIADKRVDTDPHLADDFGIVRLNTAENAAGILRVQAEMENFTRDPLTVNLKVEWYDANAMRIDTAGGGWQQQVFNPRESKSIAFTAPSRDARDFRIKLQAIED
ncbi:MAG: YcfL family protein [Kiritimatiellae bacterium]|nr:YcfL family protein [Kiritimatiellia bacterium]